MTRRYALTDHQWNQIDHLLPGRAGHVGAPAKDNRLFVDAVLYRMRWAILPAFCSRPHRHLIWNAGVLLKDIEAQMLIADNAYDAQQWVVEPTPGGQGRGHSQPPYPQSAVPVRPASPQGTPPDRELLRTHEVVPRYRYALRQDRRRIPGRYSSGCHCRMAHLMTRPKGHPFQGLSILRL